MLQSGWTLGNPGYPAPGSPQERKEPGQRGVPPATEHSDVLRDAANETSPSWFERLFSVEKGNGNAEVGALGDNPQPGEGGFSLKPSQALGVVAGYDPNTLGRAAAGGVQQVLGAKGPLSSARPGNKPPPITYKEEKPLFEEQGPQIAPEELARRNENASLPQPTAQVVEPTPGKEAPASNWNWADFLGLLLGGRGYLRHKEQENIRTAASAKEQSRHEELMAMRGEQSAQAKTLREQQMAIEYAKNLASEKQRAENAESADVRNLVRTVGQPMANIQDPLIKAEIERVKAIRAKRTQGQ